MGLDMYLKKLPKIKGQDLDLFEPHVYLEGDVIALHSISREVGYWRKANHIHKWFVDNVQNGKDDCEVYVVTKKHLLVLKMTCEKVLECPELAPELLPVQQGFFFGSTEYDEYYFKNIKDTLKIIESALEVIDADNHHLIYFSSW